MEMPFCRKCGVELQSDDKFCPNCGATYTPAKQRSEAADAKTPGAPPVVEPVKAEPTPQPAPQPAVAPTTVATPAPGKHTKQGYAGLFMCVVAVLIYFIPISPSDKMPVIFLDMVIAGVGAAWGSKAVDLGDRYGMISLIIAAIVIIMGIVTVLL